MKTALAGIIVATVLCGLVEAQTGLTGKWQGETRNGATLGLDIVAKDAMLTGTLTRNDEVTTIAEGKVAKNTFTFKATINNRTDDFAGELTGEEIRIWLVRQGPETALVLKRVKS